MEALKKVFENMPETMAVPENFVGKKGKLILIAEETIPIHKKKQ